MDSGRGAGDQRSRPRSTSSKRALEQRRRHLRLNIATGRSSSAVFADAGERLMRCARADAERRSRYGGCWPDCRSTREFQRLYRSWYAGFEPDRGLDAALPGGKSAVLWRSGRAGARARSRSNPKFKQLQQPVPNDYSSGRVHAVRLEGALRGRHHHVFAGPPLRPHRPERRRQVDVHEAADRRAAAAEGHGRRARRSSASSARTSSPSTSSASSTR